MVGGRGNKNTLYNTGTDSCKLRGKWTVSILTFDISKKKITGQAISPREAELIHKLNVARERLAAKRERERLKQMELELECMEAELQD